MRTAYTRSPPRGRRPRGWPVAAGYGTLPSPRVGGRPVGRHPAPRASEGEERMGRKVYVIGVGMTKFEKPGSKAWDYPDMAKEAGEKALADAGVPYTAVE